MRTNPWTTEAGPAGCGDGSSSLGSTARCGSRCSAQLRLALNSVLQQVETAHHTRERSAAQLRRFVGDASHELRTPLAAIRGYPQLHDKGHAHRLRRAPACLGPDAQRGRPDGPPRRRAAHPRPPRPAPRTAPPERGPLPPGP
ncbi:histidine kinase dimerization/phospho-acceptor domain-containing protein [Streptomyces caniscabiei]|uniref:histidine kinase dimerization/phospho-acceptor domain-containing protein n=1 Tax=Streptomyces caniscabiei TaxID=2746961 RepID=UPI0038D43C5A